MKCMSNDAKSVASLVCYTCGGPLERTSSSTYSYLRCQKIGCHGYHHMSRDELSLSTRLVLKEMKRSYRLITVALAVIVASQLFTLVRHLRGM